MTAKPGGSAGSASAVSCTNSTGFFVAHTDTTFMPIDGHVPALPAGIRYVITLDADTRLPIGTARRLVGKMAHPLNQPDFDPHAGVVVARSRRAATPCDAILAHR